jgi:hypothetical protein
MFSTGFSSGARDGRKIGVMLPGTSSLAVVCIRRGRATGRRGLLDDKALAAIPFNVRARCPRVGFG